MSAVDLEAVEFGLRSRMLGLGAAILEKLLDQTDRGYAGPWIACPCGSRARFVELRRKQLHTVLGGIQIRRAYYHCESCHRGEIPQDRNWDVEGTGFSPGLRRLMSRVGAQESFETGRLDLREMAGIEVCTKEVERTAEKLGGEIQAAEGARREQVFSGKMLFLPSRTPVEKVYVAVDGTGVPVVAGETVGRQGKGADGKARTREAKLGCIFTQTKVNEEGKPVRDERSTTYVGGIQTAEEFGKDLYAEVERRGLGQALHKVVVGDGAPWIWELASEHFPEATQIVDLYHAREHLWSLGRMLFENDEKKRNAWVVRRVKELDQGAVSFVLKAVDRVTMLNDSIRETVRKQTEYFNKNRDRMQYREFKAQGLFVGSGVVEAGCKTVIGQRLKQSGMRWTVRGANAIIALRRCQLSHLWEDFWADRIAR